MSAASTPSPARGLDGRVAIALLLAVALAFRLLALPGSTERNMDPDAAHFLNVAREFSRGHGFVNPAAWPAWMKPAALPMPETFKEPGYPWLIAHLTPHGGDPFRTGQAISFVAGCLIPLALYRLARNLGAGRGVALLAGLLCAASPRLIAQSVRVMVDSSFPLAITLAFAVAAWRPADLGPRAGLRMMLRDALAGALLGAALLLRGAALMSALPLGWLLIAGRPWRRALPGLALAAATGVLVASPFLLRNLRLFHTPLYSDVGAYGLWPYVDHLTFSHGLEHPPAPLGWALAHPLAVAQHWVASAVRFFAHTLSEELLGNPIWCVTLAFGLGLMPRRLPRAGFAVLAIALTLGFIFAVNWDARYFVSIVPLWCLFAALGAVEIARRLEDMPLGWGLTATPVLVAVLAVALAGGALIGRRDAAIPWQPEIEAARLEAPFLKTALGPDEAVMVVRTSYWSWFADRKSVHLVIASEPELLQVIRRLHVRYAALEISALPAFAARYAGGRLPGLFVPLRADTAQDVMMFRVLDPAAGDSAAAPLR